MRPWDRPTLNSRRSLPITREPPPRAKDGHMTTAQRTALSAMTLLCVLAYSGAASADWRIPRAKAVAAKAWNDPCAGDVDVAVEAQPGADWLASTLPSQCRITLSDQQSWGWSQLCPVLLHEYGHLAGYTNPGNPLDPHHSSNPDSIMWPFTHADRRCDRRGLPYLRNATGSRRKGGTPKL